jgi:integrase
MTLPSPELLMQIERYILNRPNKQHEAKKSVHYCLFLLCSKSGLRVSEAISFDLANRNEQSLYKITPTKRQKERYVYVSPQVINELKKNNWKPNQTNRFNFYYFLKQIKQELNIPPQVELTPHTLRRCFATYQAQAGMSLPLLSKMLGHKSIRTTALY